MIRANDLRADKRANAVKSQFKDNTDPAYVGPGIWFQLHSRSFRANDRDKQLEMIGEIRDICNGFPCHVCSDHCRKYIQEHPPEEYLDIYVDNMNLGIFVWVYLFHNAVNARINKPIMSWDTAFDLYNITEEKKDMCSKSCLAAAGNTIKSDGTITIPQVRQTTRKNFTLLKDLY